MFQTSITGVVSVLENGILTLTQQNIQTDASTEEFEYTNYFIPPSTTDQTVEMCRIADTNYVYIVTGTPIGVKFNSTGNTPLTINGLLLADISASAIYLTNADATITATVTIVFSGNRS